MREEVEARFAKAGCFLFESLNVRFTLGKFPGGRCDLSSTERCICRTPALCVNLSHAPDASKRFFVRVFTLCSPRFQDLDQSVGEVPEFLPSTADWEGADRRESKCNIFPLTTAVVFERQKRHASANSRRCLATLNTCLREQNPP